MLWEGYYNSVHRFSTPIKTDEDKVEPSQSEKVTCRTSGATITITVIVGAMGTINIFRDHI